MTSCKNCKYKLCKRRYPRDPKTGRYIKRSFKPSQEEREAFWEER